MEKILPFYKKNLLIKNTFFIQLLSNKVVKLQILVKFRLENKFKFHKMFLYKLMNPTHKLKLLLYLCCVYRRRR